MKDKLTFTVFTPHRIYPPVECDSVRLSIAESVTQKFSGSYGIRKGHTEAVFALGPGKVSASLDGREVFSAEILGGFATVEKDDVRVVTEGFKTDFTVLT